ncbi:MAG TPA: VIT domain-containing protein, partial [Planctomycetaceae bacterium]|nr:VIT domain-containing protein [Planctomycetaceae bacterium]
MSESVHDRDEDRLAALLRAGDADAAPPDAVALARIEQLAADAFRDAAPSVLPALPPSRNSPMVLFPLRLVVACSVFAAGLVAWFSAGVTDSNRVAWADVLKDIHTAETLHLQVVRDDQSADVYVHQPGRVRWEQSSTQYEIVDGSSFWRVDNGRVAAPAAAPHWLNDAGGVDLLGLLNLPATGSVRSQVLQQAGEHDYAGIRARVYSRALSEPNVRLDVYTELKTGRFVAMAAREPSAAVDAPPIAEVRLVALNPKLDEQQFAVSATLADHGVGKVTDVQGLVTLRPRVSDRWTLVCRETPLEPGDWVRTSLRGAHAAKLTLSSGQQIVIGPGALLEIVDAHQIRLTSGEIQVERTQTASGEFVLFGPGRERVAIAEAGKKLFRITADEKLQSLPQTPLWLAGFEGTTANESLGSLIVNIDGRNEPLTVGEHRVTVDIHDQIARTTIEETFVNRTAGRLEGQFHFPLPQDASISGFGMWIGNELVEADIVEKQRAREIYETILREKRDPGLLEWTGGNLFKARVFPIEPFSEKRIKITYTQVLPLRANRYRYSYGLRSELLQKFPLRELSLQVNVHSALPLKSVASPTHTCRTQATAQSARLEFTAREHTPTRDFEVVCEVDGTQSQVVVVPHRRGDDGYLLLQLLPPAPEGNWQREVLPNGEPVELLVLCDTSGSMDAAMRKTQSEFVGALLSSLGPKDRFNVAVSDVETTWLFPEPMTNTDDALTQTRDQLDQRVSLGWSNLEAMAAAALAKATSKTQIVYVGDGIVTGVQSDPQAFVTRLRVLTEQATANNQQFPSGPPTWHVISCGNTSEAVVLRAMSNLGHGSQRSITGEQPPAVVAHELLNEIMQPGLKDLQVEFRGVKVAAVYPERLPNLPAGMQQILVGRYLPTGADQQGEVIVTGRRGSEAVRYVAKIQFRDAEEGNSFIPRLWARSHLDQLLQQGSSAFLRDEIIRLSEDFHIITPYTSLLVLETDADRERFGVRKRYEMRDGERIFADGKANLRYDLMQQQMRLAEQWRLQLRKRILADLAKLGRDPQVFDPQPRYGYGRSAGRAGSYGGLGARGGSMLGRSAMLPELLAAEPAMAGVDLFRGDAFDRLSLGDFGGERMEEELILAQSGSFDKSGGVPFGALGPAVYDVEFNIGEIDEKQKWDFDFNGNGRLAKEDAASLGLVVNSPMPRSELAFGGELFDTEAWGGGGGLAGKPERLLRDGSYKRAYLSPPTVEWLNLLPTVSAPSTEAPRQRPPAWWTAEALALVKPLANAEALQQIAGGLEVRRTSQHFNEAWQRITVSPTHLELYSPTAWLTRDIGQGHPTTIEWCDANDRGALNLAMSTGRVRPAEKNDTARFRSSLLVDPLEVTYRQYIPTVTRPAADRAVLALRQRSQSHVSMRLTIDTVRK